jgi:SAM-dependent methyltransferase
VPASVGLKEGRAEALPFRDGWFDAAVCWLSAHLFDRPRAFVELRRVLVPDGRLVVATFDPAYFEVFWLNRLFPAMRELDLERFPGPDELEQGLGAAGFDVRLERLSQASSMSREYALERIRGRHISTFQLIGDDEYREGLERAERELPERVDYVLEWLLVAATAAR